MSQAVLVDTSVWVDHFRNGNPELVRLLTHDQVWCHSMVIGELACGTPPDRKNTLADLRALPQAPQPTPDEVLAFIERFQLYGKGVGLVDLTLLAGTLLQPGASLWTLDNRLAKLAGSLAIRYHGGLAARN